jgi:hypothetical protein
MRKLKQAANECRQRALDRTVQVDVKQGTRLYFENDRVERTENTTDSTDNITRQTANQVTDDRADDRQTADKTENRTDKTVDKAENRIKKTKNLTFCLSHFHAAHRNNISIILTEKVRRIFIAQIRSTQTGQKTRYSYTHHYFFHVIHSYYRFVKACETLCYTI